MEEVRTLTARMWRSSDWNAEVFRSLVNRSYNIMNLRNVDFLETVKT